MDTLTASARLRADYPVSRPAPPPRSVRVSPWRTLKLGLLAAVLRGMGYRPRLTAQGGKVAVWILV